MDLTFLQGAAVSPPLFPYWEKCCREIGGIPEIRYIDEIAATQFDDFDGLCLREGQEILIALNRGLNTEEAGLTALHEITHALLFKRGFWEVRCGVNCEMLAPIAACYSSVLTDPLIDRMLRDEGYKVGILLWRDFRKIRRWLDEPDWETPEEDDPLYDMEVMRLLRLLLADEPGLTRGLEACYIERAEAIWDAASECSHLIGEADFNSPERQLICLNKLIARSSLKSMLSLHSSSAVDGERLV